MDQIFSVSETSSRALSDTRTIFFPPLINMHQTKRPAETKCKKKKKKTPCFNLSHFISRHYKTESGVFRTFGDSVKKFSGFL
jgi:hypothetical protein